MRLSYARFLRLLVSAFLRLFFVHLLFCVAVHAAPVSLSTVRANPARRNLVSNPTQAALVTVAVDQPNTEKNPFNNTANEGRESAANGNTADVHGGKDREKGAEKKADLQDKPREQRTGDARGDAGRDGGGDGGGDGRGDGRGEEDEESDNDDPNDMQRPMTAVEMFTEAREHSHKFVNGGMIQLVEWLFVLILVLPGTFPIYGCVILSCATFWRRRMSDTTTRSNPA